jgi:hypothetical protein
MDSIVAIIIGLLEQVALPDWVVLTLILVISGIAFYVGVLKGKLLPAPVTALIAKMQKHFVTYESVEPRIKVAVEKFRLTPEFAGWLTKTLTNILVSVPALQDEPLNHVADVMSKAFITLPEKEQKRILPALQGVDAGNVSFVIQQILSAILLLPQIIEMVKGVIRTVQDGADK